MSCTRWVTLCSRSRRLTSWGTDWVSSMQNMEMASSPWKSSKRVCCFQQLLPSHKLRICKPSSLTCFQETWSCCPTTYVQDNSSINIWVSLKREVKCWLRKWFSKVSNQEIRHQLSKRKMLVERKSLLWKEARRPKRTRPTKNKRLKRNKLNLTSKRWSIVFLAMWISNLYFVSWPQALLTRRSQLRCYYRRLLNSLCSQ